VTNTRDQIRAPLSEETSMTSTLRLISPGEHDPDDIVDATDAPGVLRSELRRAVLERVAFERMASIDRAYRKFLRTAGRGYRTDRGVVWVDHTGRAWDAGSEEFLSWLALQGDLPAGAYEFSTTVRGAIRTVCLIEHGGRASPVSFSICQDGALLIRRDDQSLFRVHDQVTNVVNGTDGILLRRVEGFMGLAALPEPTITSPTPPRWLRMLTTFEFEDFTPFEAAMLLAVILFFFILPTTLTGTAPAIGLMGPAGCGKTTLLRVCIRLLCGCDLVELPPDQWGADSLETALSRMLAMGIDELDDADSRLAATIRAVISGARRTRRKKYSDDDLHVLAPDARIVIASNGCPFDPTEANLSRLAPFSLLARRDGFAREGSFEAMALEVREQFWTDALELIRLVRPSILTDKRSASHRLAGFDSFVHAVAEVLPLWSPHLISALGKLEKVRACLILEDDQVAEYVRRLALGHAQGWQGSASALLGEFRGTLPAARDMAWDGWSPERLAKRLLAIAPALKRAWAIDVSRPPRTAKSRGFVITSLQDRPPLIL
jgi:hypothetical protein